LAAQNHNWLEQIKTLQETHMSIADQGPQSNVEGLEYLIRAVPHAKLFANLGIVYSFLALCTAPVPIVIAISMGERLSYAGATRLVLLAVTAVLFWRACFRIKRFAQCLAVYQKTSISGDLSSAFEAQASYWRLSAWILLVLGGGLVLTTAVDLIRVVFRAVANQ
jgi:hypothetical protein